MVIDLQNQAIDSLIDSLIKENKKIIIDIYATWCGPCKMLAPQLEQFANKHDDWTVIRVDSDKHLKIAQSFNVQAVPTMIVIVNEKIVQTIVGFKPASEIEKIVSKY